MEDSGRASFDVFLSHSAADKREVALLAASLRERGLRPWLDVEQIAPGVRFQGAVAAGLAASRSFAVFVGRGDVGAWVAEELDAAVAQAVADPSFRVFLVLLPGAPDPFDATGLHAFLSQRSWVDLRRLADRPDAAGDLVARAVRGEPVGLVDHVVGGSTSQVCPYVGLRAFRPEEGPWFFGRDADVQRVTEKLRAHGFVAVLGRSGVGKSSTVQAGVVPAVTGGRVIPGSEDWTVRVLRPTASPLEELAAYVSELRADLPADRVLAELASSDVALRLLTAGVHGGSAPVLWVVDQAEELFTLCSDAGQRRSFAANLLHAAQAGGPARVVVTVRADFYPRFTEVPAFGARMAQSQHVLADLDDEQLREVITEPATLVGSTFEAGLVERIVEDVRAQAGALPLLQHALRELWGRRRGARIVHDAYDEIGGVYGTIRRVADVALADIEAAGDGPVARRLLVELVRIGEGVEDTRQPVRLSDLAAPAHPPARLHAVAARLADARLVTTDRDGDRPADALDGSDGTGGADVTVELVHDAVIRSWPTLQRWLDENRDDIRATRRIRDAARAWRGEGRPHELLYRGGVLAAASNAVRERRAELPDLERDFLAASIHREQADQRRTRRRRAGVLAVLGTLTVLMLVAALVATNRSVQARDARREAEVNAARALVQQARALTPERPALALAVAAEAHERLGDDSSADALQRAHLAFGEAPGHIEQVLEGHTDAVTSVAYHPDGTHIVTGSYDGTARIWGASTGETTTTLEGHDDWVAGVAFSPDGATVATASLDRTAKLWDAETGDEQRTLAGHADGLTALAFQPRGDLLATAARDGTVRLWHTTTGTEVASIPTRSGWVLGLAFSQDGHRLATAGRNGTARIWDVTTRRELAAFPEAHDAATAVAFSPDGRQLATAGRDARARIWDIETREERTTVSVFSWWITGIAFSPDGSRLATASGDGTTQLWDTATGERTLSLAGHTDAANAVAFSPDGQHLATAGQDGSAILWNPGHGDEAVRLTGPTGHVSDIAFGPDGRQVATSSGDGVARLWDSHTGELLRSFPGPGPRPSSVSVALNPTGDVIATGSADGVAHLWDTDTGDLLDELDGHDDAIASLAFGGGHLLATAGADHDVVVWDLDTGTAIHELHGHRDVVRAVRFSPDGRRLASASFDQSVRLWDVTSGEEELRLPRGGTTVAFDRDGGEILTDDIDGTATLWDATTGEAVTTFERHTDLVAAVAFSPDGETAATTSNDATTKLWDTSTGTEIATLPGHNQPVTSVAFSPDSTRLATTSNDQTALIRHLVLTTTDACDVVALEITRTELTTALGGDEPRACTSLR